MGKKGDCGCRCEVCEEKCAMYLSVYNANRASSDGYYGMTPSKAHKAALEAVKAFKCEECR